MLNARYAIMIDGEFCRLKLFNSINKGVVKKKRQPVTAKHVVDHINAIKALPQFKDQTLLRAYFYDCEPLRIHLKQPVTGNPWDLTRTQRYRRATSMLDQLKQTQDVAVRLGHLTGATRRFPWALRDKVAEQLIRNNAQVCKLTDDDFILDIQQKGVDMRIGLDIARLTLRELVHTIVVVTGDSDFVPAFKFARREGVRVVLLTMGHSVLPQLTEHADLVITDTIA